MLNYFVNGSRGWMMTCDMVKECWTIVRKVITRVAQMDFFTTFLFVVVLQYLIGHFAPLALQVGVSQLLVFVISFLSFHRIANYFDHGKCPRVFSGHVTFHVASTDG